MKDAPRSAVPALVSGFDVRVADGCEHVSCGSLLSFCDVFRESAPGLLGAFSFRVHKPCLGQHLQQRRPVVGRAAQGVAQSGSLGRDARNGASADLKGAQSFPKLCLCPALSVTIPHYRTVYGSISNYALDLALGRFHIR